MVWNILDRGPLENSEVGRRKGGRSLCPERTRILCVLRGDGIRRVVEKGHDLG